jgi:hypothetical protein
MGTFDDFDLAEVVRLDLVFHVLRLQQVAKGIDDLAKGVAL